jgi:hypothetical protein
MTPSTTVMSVTQERLDPCCAEMGLASKGWIAPTEPSTAPMPTTGWPPRVWNRPPMTTRLSSGAATTAWVMLSVPGFHAVSAPVAVVKAAALARAFELAVPNEPTT